MGNKNFWLAFFLSAGVGMRQLLLPGISRLAGWTAPHLALEALGRAISMFSMVFVRSSWLSPTSAKNRRMFRMMRWWGSSWIAEGLHREGHGEHGEHGGKWRMEKRNVLISMAELLACNRVVGSPAPPRRTTRPRWAQWPPRCPRRPAAFWFSFSWASAAPGGLATLSDANNASQAGGLGWILQKDTKPSEFGALHRKQLGTMKPNDYIFTLIVN